MVIALCYITHFYHKRDIETMRHTYFVCYININGKVFYELICLLSLVSFQVCNCSRMQKDDLKVDTENLFAMKPLFEIFHFL